MIDLKFAESGAFNIGASPVLDTVEEIIPSPCRYCLQPLKEGDEVVFVVWRVLKIPEIEPIHRGCRKPTA